MVKNIGTQHSLSGLNNVFKSLPSNAKSILLLLIKNRIENKNDKKYGGKLYYAYVNNKIIYICN